MNPTRTFDKKQAACAAAIVVTFFMPWVQLFGLSGSGYSLSRFGSYGNAAWLIPILAAATLFKMLTGTPSRLLTIVAGVAPFLGLAYAVTKVGRDLLQVMAIGFYLTLVAGAALIALAVMEAFQLQPSAAAVPAAAASAPSSECPNCRTVSDSGDRYCAECGVQLVN